MPRRRVLIVVAGAVMLLALVGVLVWPGRVLVGRTAGASTTGGPVPANAAAVARQLVSGSAEQQRATLLPSLAGALPAGPLFAGGASLALDADGWHQAGQYADATGTLTEPGSAPSRVELGFVLDSGTWRVTFEERLP